LPSEGKRQSTLLSTADGNRKGWASTWMSHDGFHEKSGGETPVFSRTANGGFWPKKVKNTIFFQWGLTDTLSAISVFDISILNSLDGKMANLLLGFAT